MAWWKAGQASRLAPNLTTPAWRAAGTARRAPIFSTSRRAAARSSTGLSHVAARSAPSNTTIWLLIVMAGILALAQRGSQRQQMTAVTHRRSCSPDARIEQGKTGQDRLRAPWPRERRHHDL